MVSKQDLALFIYNYAVVVSGAYILIGLGFDGRVQVFAVGALFALFWTAYFRWSVASKIAGGEDEEGDESEELPTEA